MLELLKLLVIVGGVLTLAFMILLALPHCKLRDMMMPFVAWGFVVLCAAYCISPLDCVPDVIFPVGFIDDFGVAVAGVMTAVKTVRAARQKHSSFQDPYFNN